MLLYLFFMSRTTVKAWQPPTTVLSSRAMIHTRRPSSTTLSMVRSATNSNNQNNKHASTVASKASHVFQKGLVQLGRGIWFAKPMGPTVAQALFGIPTKRKNDKNKPAARSVGIDALPHALGAIAAYGGMGVLFYTLVEQWTIIDALYFSMAVFTTVGFGDVVPSTALSKVFTCFFSLGGVAILAAALAAIGTQVIVESETKVARRWNRQLPQWRRRCQALLPKRGPRRGNRSNEKEPAAQTRVGQQQQNNDASNVTAVVRFQPPPTQVDDHTAKPPPTVHPIQVLAQITPRLGLLASLGMLVGRLEGWSVLDSLYFSISTASTMGLGDLAPQRQVSRLVAALCIPLAVATGGEILGTLAAMVWQRRRAALLQSVLQKDFSMDHIKEMDTNGDGHVSKLDYLEFMLVEMQLVDKGVLDELESQFDRLDMTKGGSVSKKDLILMVKMRRRKQQEMDAAVVDVPVPEEIGSETSTGLKSAHTAEPAPC